MLVHLPQLLNATITMPEPGTMPASQHGQLLQKKVRELTEQMFGKPGEQGGQKQQQQPQRPAFGGLAAALRDDSNAPSTLDVPVKAGLTPEQVTNVNRQLLAEQQLQQQNAIAQQELGIRQQNADAVRQQLALQTQAHQLRLAEALLPKPEKFSIQNFDNKLYRIGDRGTQEIIAEGTPSADYRYFETADGRQMRVNEATGLTEELYSDPAARTMYEADLASKRRVPGGGSSSPYVSVGGSLFNKLTGAFASPEEVAAARAAQISPDTPDSRSPQEAIAAREGAENRVTAPMAAALRSAGVDPDNPDFLTEGIDGKARYNPQALLSAMLSSDKPELRRQAAYWQGVISTIEGEYRQGNATPPISPYVAPGVSGPAEATGAPTVVDPDTEEVYEVVFSDQPAKPKYPSLGDLIRDITLSGAIDGINASGSAYQRR